MARRACVATRTLLLLLLLLWLLGCNSSPPRSSVARRGFESSVAGAYASTEGSIAGIGPSASSAPAPSASAEAEPAWSAEAKEIQVPGDRHVFAVMAPPAVRQTIAYFHGRCGDPLAFRAFAKILGTRATLVSMVGDVACDNGRAKWNDDVVALDHRVSAALGAVAAARGADLDADHLLAIGYSAGALRVEALAERFPERYPRVILIGGPRAPRRGALAHAISILLMGGELDLWMPLQDGAAQLAKDGRPARFIKLPGARHGDYGPDAEATMSDALDWSLRAP